MRARARHIAKGVALGALAGAAWIGSLPEAAAQTALCPNVVSIPPSSIVTIENDSSFSVLAVLPPTQTQTVLTGIKTTDGLCSTDAGAFSGAALASQALSELSQSTTQATTRSTGNAITDRREAERQRCAEGFTRVDGACERIAPRVVEAVPEAPPAPRVEPLRTKAAKAKPAPVSRREPAPAVKAVRVAAPLPPPPPVFVEPEARFGAWAQVIGDYERRTASGLASITALANPANLGDRTLVGVPLTTRVSSRTGMVGFQVGADLTSRGVLVQGDGIIIGGFGGYVTSDLSLGTTAASGNPALVGTGTSTANATIAGATAGLYATYFTGPFSADFLLKIDALTLHESFTDNLAFAPGPADLFLPFSFVYSSSASTGLLNGTVAGNLNYRFPFYRGWWVEPTVGAQYTNTSYGTGAQALGLSDGSLVMVQGGARFGTSTLIDNKVLLTTTLTGLAYSNVLVSGGFIPGAGFAGNNILARADEGQVRGRGVLAFNLDFGNGIKSFVLGEVRGGQGLLGAGGKAGVRLEW